MEVCHTDSLGIFLHAEQEERYLEEKKNWRRRLEQMPLSQEREDAILFAAQLTEKLNECGAAKSEKELVAVPFTPDVYVEAMMGEQPVLFHSSPQSHRGQFALVQLLSQRHASVLVDVRWPQEGVEKEDIPMSVFGEYFREDCEVRAPPTIVDNPIDLWGVLGYDLPNIVKACTLMEGTDRCALFHKPDVVFSPKNAITAFHIDMGFAGWLDMSDGSKDWAICNWQDGGDLDKPSFSLKSFLSLSSARICRVSAGQSLFVPAADAHFVVTRSPSAAVSHDLMTVGCAQKARDFYSKGEVNNLGSGQDMINAGIKVHGNNVQNILQELVACGVSKSVADRYCHQLKIELKIAEAQTDLEMKNYGFGEI
eukprot:CAMPEP_0196577246 /NCGR_PEP_ID=MMETSP1081-20130531/6348_1 /TAXON_ID=36882 /ORGANISM="Pyramimonas amylifera, Strain CCMP720" /LENGTH=366 /DNA_ID=CAMNT_0041896121 /DNA_START=154 /DNA_END=1254 /DNA_ORIENTATION=-